MIKRKEHTVERKRSVMPHKWGGRDVIQEGAKRSTKADLVMGTLGFQCGRIPIGGLIDI